jgi:hypothetical protein
MNKIERRSKDMTWQEKVEAARARGIPEQAIQEVEAPRQRMLEMITASDRVAAADAAVTALDKEDAVLAQEAVHRSEDLELAQRRAQRHLDAARETVQPYEAALQFVAHRRAELAERRVAAERERAAARAHEAEVFARRTTA